MTPPAAFVIESLTSFVRQHSAEVDLQFGYIPDGLDAKVTAAYLLLVASVNQGARAEVVGEFVRALWNVSGPELFRMAAVDSLKVRQVVGQTRERVGLSRATSFDDAAVLQSATRYVATHGDLPAHSRRFTTPSAMVEHLAAGILYFGRDPMGARKKAWMYMRWMVRPTPDLRLFSTFSPDNLEFPLDRNTCRALAEIRALLPDEPTLSRMDCESGVPRADAGNRYLATEFAKKLFPADPIIMDYPLFLLGRSGNVRRALMGR